MVTASDHWGREEYWGSTHTSLSWSRIVKPLSAITDALSFLGNLGISPDTCVYIRYRTNIKWWDVGNSTIRCACNEQLSNVVMLVVITPIGRLKLWITWCFKKEFTCINDCISVGICFFKSMWKCGFHLANCRHTIDFSMVMVQKANPYDEIFRDRTCQTV